MLDESCNVYLSNSNMVGSQDKEVVAISQMIFFKPVIIFTTAQTKLTTKRAVLTANTLYMEFVKQWLILNSAVAFSVELLWKWPFCCTFMCMCMQEAIFFVLQHWMNIAISWQLTACLSSTPQSRTDLQQHNYYYPAILLLPPPFILTILSPLTPLYLSQLYLLSLFLHFLPSLCHWSLMRLAASMLSNDLHWKPAGCSFWPPCRLNCHMAAINGWAERNTKSHLQCPNLCCAILPILMSHLSFYQCRLTSIY